ncbi:MAG: NADH:flavin oxidoreductase [Nitrospinota bacterium]
MSEAPALALLQPGKIGGVETRNRFIRSATSESLADENGFITDGYRDLHLTLARSGVGLIFTGHCYVHPRGKYARCMTGLDRDDHVGPLQRLTESIHVEGGKIFAQLNHAGSQSRVPQIEPIAPSVVPNPQTGRTPREATEEEIVEVITAFGEAAARVKAAGFDGVHLHAGHGYLLTEFLSPHTNQRKDRWGGPLENRQRLLLEVVRAMREAVGEDFPVTVKLGVRDFVLGGLILEQGLSTAAALDRAGVNAIEVSAGLMSPKVESAVQYTALSRKRALQDNLLHRIFSKPRPEAYFREEACRVRERVGCPVILVGGLRTVETMESVIAEGVADFVSLARPFIREPDLVSKVERGKRGVVDCTSCNICIQHEGVHPLKCWRQSNKDLLIHAWHRLTGQLH